MTKNECTLRPMKCELNQLTMPDGSSMLLQGETCVIAGVYGPVEARLQKVIYDKASIEVSYTPMEGPPSITNRMNEEYIKETCEPCLITTQYPSTSISINVQEMQDHGGLLSCAINAACMALINSSICMKSTVAAVNCMIDAENDQLLIDPDDNQLKNSRATFTFAFDSVKKDVISCYTSGSFSQTEFVVALEKCKEASAHVFDFYRDVVKKYAYRM